MRLIDADAAIKDARINYGDVHDAVLMEHFLNSQPTISPPQNNPLTLEELRDIYDGEQGPVWIKFGVVVMPAILDRYDGELMAIWSALGKDDALSEKNYGYTWAAYRRRPEEGTL